MPEQTEVRTATDAEPLERETHIQWASDENRASVFSEEASLMRRLLRNPVFELDQLRLEDGDIVAVWGYLPIGSVRMKGKPSQSDRHSKVHTRAGLREEPVSEALQEAIEEQATGDGVEYVVSGSDGEPIVQEA